MNMLISVGMNKDILKQITHTYINKYIYIYIYIYIIYIYIWKHINYISVYIPTNNFVYYNWVAELHFIK